MAQLNLVASLVGLFYLVDPVVSSKLSVKSEFKFVCFAEFCGSIRLGGQSVRLDSVVSLQLIVLVQDPKAPSDALVTYIRVNWIQ